MLRGAQGDSQNLPKSMPMPREECRGFRHALVVPCRRCYSLCALMRCRVAGALMQHIKHCQSSHSVNAQRDTVSQKWESDARDTNCRCVDDPVSGRLPEGPWGSPLPLIVPQHAAPRGCECSTNMSNDNDTVQHQHIPISTLRTYTACRETAVQRS